MNDHPERHFCLEDNAIGPQVNDLLICKPSELPPQLSPVHVWLSRHG
jgi:hypothetical protein